MGYYLAFGSLATVLVYVGLTYNSTVAAGLVPKDDAMRLAVVSSDFNVSISFHGLTISPSKCASLKTSNTPNAVLTTSGINILTANMEIICEPGNLTIQWHCLGCSLSGGAVLDFELSQPLQSGDLYGLVDHKRSTLGDTEAVPDALTILQATQIDWRITATPCVHKLPVGGMAENNTVRGTLRYDFDGSSMAWYQPNIGGNASKAELVELDGVANTSHRRRLTNATTAARVEARLFRGETAEVTVSATPSLYKNDISGEETTSFRLQWLLDAAAAGRTLAAFMSPIVENSIRFRMVLQGTNQMLKTSIDLEYTYLALLSAVGGLASAIAGVIYSVVIGIDSATDGIKKSAEAAAKGRRLKSEVAEKMKVQLEKSKSFQTALQDVKVRLRRRSSRMRRYSGHMPPSEVNLPPIGASAVEAQLEAIDEASKAHDHCIVMPLPANEPSSSDDAGDLDRFFPGCLQSVLAGDRSSPSGNLPPQPLVYNRPAAPSHAAPSHPPAGTSVLFLGADSDEEKLEILLAKAMELEHPGIDAEGIETMKSNIAAGRFSHSHYISMWSKRLGEMGIKTDGEGTADPRNTDGDVPDTSFEECRHLVFEIGNV